MLLRRKKLDTMVGLLMESRLGGRGQASEDTQDIGSANSLEEDVLFHCILPEPLGLRAAPSVILPGDGLGFLPVGVLTGCLTLQWVGSHQL